MIAGGAVSTTPRSASTRPGAACGELVFGDGACARARVGAHASASASAHAHATCPTPRVVDFPRAIARVRAVRVCDGRAANPSSFPRRGDHDTATGASAKTELAPNTGISRSFWREHTCCAHPRARPRCRWRRAPSWRAASASRRVDLGASAWRVARRSREPRPRATGPGRRTTTPPRGRHRHRRRRLLPPRRRLLRPRRTIDGRRSRSSASPRRARPPPVGSCGPPGASPRARA